MASRCSALARSLVVLASFVAAVSAGAENLVQNGDFSNGLANWSIVRVRTSFGGTFPQITAAGGSSCIAGNYPAAAFNVPSSADGYIEQSIALPDTPLSLTYTTWGEADATTLTTFIVDSGGAHQVDLLIAPQTLTCPTMTTCFCDGRTSTTRIIDISAYRNQTVQLRFRATSGGINGTFAFVENVSIEGPAAQLSATIESPGAVAPGENFDVTVVVTNTGSATVESVAPPTNLTITGEGLATRSATSPQIIAVDLEPAGQQTYHYTYTATREGDITIQAAATGLDANSNTVTSNTASVVKTISRSTLVAAFKDVPEEVSVGEEFEFALEVTNNGDVAVRDVAPDGEILLIGSDAGVDTTFLEKLSGPEPASVASLEHGAAARFAYRYKGKQVGSGTFTGSAKGTQGDQTLTSNAAASDLLYIRGLEVADVEPVQTVYGADLVADKPTVVRATFRNGFDTAQTVTVELKIEEGNRTRTQRQTLELAPGVTRKKVLFIEQVFRMTTSGRLTLSIDPDNELTVENDDLKRESVDAAVHVVAPLRTLLKSVAVRNICASSQGPGFDLPAAGEPLHPSAFEVAAYKRELDAFLLGVFPVASFSADVDTSPLVYEPTAQYPNRMSQLTYLSCADQLSEIHTRLARYAKRTGYDRVIGLLPHQERGRNIFTLWELAGVTGALGETYRNAAGSIVAAFDLRGGSGRDRDALHAAPAVAAHELGHTFGLPFFSNQVSAFAPEEYAVGVPGRPSSDGVWIDTQGVFIADGFEEIPEQVGTRFNIMASSEVITDVVSNGIVKVWINKQDYEHILSRLSAGSRDPLVALVSGAISVDNVVVADPWHTFFTDEVSEETDPDGPFAIVMLDKDGGELRRFRFDLEFTKARNPTGGTSEFVPFVFNIEIPDGLARIEVRKDAVALFARDVTPNTPRIDAITPAGGESFNPGDVMKIEWTAFDADDDLVTFNVFFSEDDGQRWTPLTLDLDSGSFEWTVPDIRTDFARIKVEGCDGINTGVLQSARFSIFGSGGTLVASPGGDQFVTVGAEVKLDGGVSRDPADAPLTFRWRLAGAPDGGLVDLLDADQSTASFIPPVAGRYLVELIVNNGAADSAPAFATITAVDGEVVQPPKTPSTDDPIPTVNECGTGLCGAGFANMMPLTLLGLLAMKSRTVRRRAASIISSRSSTPRRRPRRSPAAPRPRPARRSSARPARTSRIPCPSSHRARTARRPRRR